MQFIHHGVVARGEPGLVLAFEEVPQQLYRVTVLALERGDVAGARALLNVNLRPDWREGMPLVVCHPTEMIGRVQIAEGKGDEARELFTHSLTSLHQMRFTIRTAHGMDGLARLALSDNRPERATRLLGVREALLERLGMNMMPIERSLYDYTVAEARARLTADTFAAAWEGGPGHDAGASAGLCAARGAGCVERRCHDPIRALVGSTIARRQRAYEAGRMPSHL